MLTSLFRLILINYLYHPRQYITSLFRLIPYNVISIVWHDINLFRLILYYKFVTFWHDVILLHVCQYSIYQHKERTKKRA